MKYVFSFCSSGVVGCVNELMKRNVNLEYVGKKLGVGERVFSPLKEIKGRTLRVGNTCRNQGSEVESNRR
jgi:hypothetical protein